MFSTIFSVTDNKSFHKILNGKELSTPVTFHELWTAYQQPRKDAWTVGELPTRLQNAKYKFNILSEVATMNSQLSRTSNLNHLDIGSGDGTMGNELSRRYSLKTHYTDVENNFKLEEEEFSIFDPSENIKSEQLNSVVSMLHILHHIPSYKELKFRIKNVYNLLSSEGLLLIREHDVKDSTLYNKICMQHICYEMSELKAGLTRVELLKWIKSYKLNLFSMQDLKTIIQEVGFVRISNTEPTVKDGSYFILFKKI